jgi:hypothetical protein
MMVVAYLMVMAYPEGFDPAFSRIRPAQESSWLPNRFCYFVLIGTSIESEHNDQMLGKTSELSGQRYQKGPFYVECI